MTEEKTYQEILDETIKYIRDNFDIDEDGRKVIRNVLEVAHGMPEWLRARVVESALNGLGFCEAEIQQIIDRKAPSVKSVPVYLKITRPYRTWVTVPSYATEEQIKDAAYMNVIAGQDAAIELDDSISIEANDVEFDYIDEGSIET